MQPLFLSGRWGRSSESSHLLTIYLSVLSHCPSPCEVVWLPFGATLCIAEVRLEAFFLREDALHQLGNSKKLFVRIQGQRPTMSLLFSLINDFPCAGRAPGSGRKNTASNTRETGHRNENKKENMVGLKHVAGI